MIDYVDELHAEIARLDAEVKWLRGKNRHLQHLLIKERGECWDCRTPLEYIHHRWILPCDPHNCERQRQEDMDLMMEESE